MLFFFFQRCWVECYVLFLDLVCVDYRVVNVDRFKKFLCYVIFRLKFMLYKGYTFLGRYNLLDRGTDIPSHDWSISDVLLKLGSEISSAVSLGCSVGVNEAILGVMYPSLNLVAVDINPEYIRVAKSGVWKHDDIMMSEFAARSSDINLEKLYERFCPREYFEIDFDERTLKLSDCVPSVLFGVSDATSVCFSDNSFDLVMIHMLAGEKCHYYDNSYVKLGEEVERIVKPGGFLWYYGDTSYNGLFRVIPDNGSSSPYYRVLNNESDYMVETVPTAKKYLFMGPEWIGN